MVPQKWGRSRAVTTAACGGNLILFLFFFLQPFKNAVWERNESNSSHVKCRKSINGCMMDQLCVTKSKKHDQISNVSGCECLEITLGRKEVTLFPLHTTPCLFWPIDHQRQQDSEDTRRKIILYSAISSLICNKNVLQKNLWRFAFSF